MLHICGVYKTLGEWYQKTKRKIQMAAAIQRVWQLFCDQFLKETFADSFQKLYEICQPCVVKGGDYFEGQ
jgi:hypothetical protein